MAVAEILGREAEVQAVGRFLDGSAPAALILEGPAGIGKTTVWRAGIERATGLGHRVLTTRPSQVETAPATAGLMDLLGEVFDEHAGALPPLQRSALAVALLREDGEDTQPGTVSAATLGLLRRAAQDSTVLVGIDDLQWLDAATAAALTFALRRLGDAPVLLLATVRTDDCGEGEQPVPIPGERMVIPPLNVESLSRVITRELRQRLPWPVVRRIAEIAAGNAFLAVELAVVASRPGTDADELSPAVLSRLSHVRRLAETRVRVLPEATRTALGIVAALGEPAGSVLSRALADEAALDVAFRVGVIEEDGDRVRFCHPLLAAAALASLPPWRRRSIHRALADLADTPVERARHLAAAIDEPSADLAAAIEEGAADALSRAAPSAAAQLYEQAARLTPADDRVALSRRLMRAGDCREQAGDIARAFELFHRALRESPPGPQRARARLSAAWHELTPIDEGLAEKRIALDECGADLAARAECLFGITMSLIHLGDLRSARRCVEEIRRLSEELKDLDVHVSALSYSGYLDAQMTPGSGRDALEEAVRLAAGRLITSSAVAPESMLATVRLWADEIEPARVLLLDIRDRALTAGDEEGAASAAHALTEVEVRAGELRRARAYADEAVAVIDVDRDDVNLSGRLYMQALAVAHLGDEELTRRLVTRGLAMSESLGDRLWVTLHRSVLGFLELSLDRPAEAAAHLAQVAADVRNSGVEEPGAFQHRNDLLEALVAAGRIKEAERLLTDMRSLGQRLDRPRLLCVTRRAEAALAARRGDHGTAQTLLEEALGIHDRLPVPLERGRTLLALGMTHRRAKHRRAARERLTEAEELFDGMGAKIWRDRARRELSRISGRAPGDRDTLTSTERQIAELVASGRTNRDVAAELFITVRTVEANLTRIYSKLGVRSRGQLAARRGKWA